MPKSANVGSPIFINIYTGCFTILQGRGYVDDSGIVALTAARIEQQMLKAEATERWHNAKVPASKPNSSPSPMDSTIPMRRALLEDSDQGCRFKANTACNIKRNQNFVGGNIPNNFIKGMKKWQDCCAACFKRTDCVAWTINKDKNKEYRRGCYLKGAGYRTKNKSTFVSGTMTDVDRE